MPASRDIATQYVIAAWLSNGEKTSILRKRRTLRQHASRVGEPVTQVLHCQGQMHSTRVICVLFPARVARHAPLPPIPRARAAVLHARRAHRMHHVRSVAARKRATKCCADDSMLRVVKDGTRAFSL
jgi:hypothetical protein